MCIVSSKASHRMCGNPWGWILLAICEVFRLLFSVPRKFVREIIKQDFELGQNRLKSLLRRMALS